jgi:hypothetical protein
MFIVLVITGLWKYVIIKWKDNWLFVSSNLTPFTLCFIKAQVAKPPTGSAGSYQVTGRTEDRFTNFMTKRVEISGV